MRDAARQSVPFPAFVKSTVVAFDTDATSSDGGSILLRELDDRLALTAAVAAALTDGRQLAKVDHSMHDLCGNECSGWPWGTPTATTAPACAATGFSSWSSIAIRSRVGHERPTATAPIADA